MGKKHVIIGIRYSMLSSTSKGWILCVENEFKEYQEKLFEPARLKNREEIFERITLPSLTNIFDNKPEDVEFVVHILTSIGLPEENKKFLNQIEEKYSFIKVSYYTPEEANTRSYFTNYIKNNVEEKDVYASVRLDDDDALSLDWFNKILDYMNPAFNGFVVSLCSGLAVSITSHDYKIDKISAYKYRFIALGMTYIGVKTKAASISVYGCGNHTKTDDKYPTLVLAKGTYILRTFNNYNDSGSAFPSTKYLDKSESQESLAKFGLSDELLSSYEF